MEVRWLVTDESVGSQATVVGRTMLRPGSKHAIHRHVNAEEWGYVVRGRAIRHIGDEQVALEAGDVVCCPAGVFHGWRTAEHRTAGTVWGHSGAASLEQAGYELP